MSVVEAGHPVAQTQAPFHPKAGYPRHRWTVAEYHKMGEVGLLNQADRVELIEGELFGWCPSTAVIGLFQKDATKSSGLPQKF